MKKALLVTGIIISLMFTAISPALALQEDCPPWQLRALLSLPCCQPALDSSAGLAPATVVVNGDILNFDVPPVLINDRWLVPMRAIFEKLGAQVQWDSATSTAIASRQGTIIMLQLNKPTAMVNNVPFALDSPATAINGRTMVPLRFVSESLESRVSYSSESNTVIITHTDNPGTSGIYYATMCESVDSSTWSPVNPGSEFSGEASRLCAYMVLNQALKGTLAVNWYFVSGSEREFVTSDRREGNGESDIYYFVLDQSHFQDGFWQCELIIDKRLIQTLAFTISGSELPDIPPVESSYNSHPWDEWGLGQTEEEYVDNDNRSYDWYIDQYDTGDYWYENCGPAVVTMASKWSDPGFSRTAEQARQTYKPNGGWWVIDLPGNDADINNYLDLYGIPYYGRNSNSSYEDMTSRMMRDLRSGYILILCIDSSYITENYDDNERTGKPYSTGRNSGHFIIVKGFATVDGDTYFEVYDPANGNKRYSDGTPMCKNRYYSDDDIHDAMTVWWNRYLYVDQVNGSRLAPAHSDTALPAWPGFSRTFPSYPAFGS